MHRPSLPHGFLELSLGLYVEDAHALVVGELFLLGEDLLFDHFDVLALALLVVQGVDEALVQQEVVAAEEADVLAAVGVAELALAFHLGLLPLALVDVSYGPLKLALAFEVVFFVAACVYRPVFEDSDAVVSLLFVSVPPAFVLGEDAVRVATAVEDLETVTVAHHLELLLGFFI